MIVALWVEYNKSDRIEIFYGWKLQNIRTKQTHLCDSHEPEKMESKRAKKKTNIRTYFCQFNFGFIWCERKNNGPKNKEEIRPK